MTLPATGQPISLSQVNVQLGASATAIRTMNDAALRSLFGVPSGQISMSQGWGKPSYVPGNSGILTSSQTYTLPSTCGSTIYIYAVGGGGGGGGGSSRAVVVGGGGGGSSKWMSSGAVTVTAGQAVTVTVGAGGTAGGASDGTYSYGSNGGAGGASSVVVSGVTKVLANGGGGGACGYPGGGAAGAVAAAGTGTVSGAGAAGQIYQSITWITGYDKGTPVYSTQYYGGASGAGFNISGGTVTGGAAGVGGIGLSVSGSGLTFRLATAGTTYGGGGGGGGVNGASNDAYMAGKAGSGGFVYIWW